jgi:hypothetical protein
VHKYVILIPEVLFPTCFRYLANIEAILKGSKSSKVIEIRDSRFESHEHCKSPWSREMEAFGV